MRFEQTLVFGSITILGSVWELLGEGVLAFRVKWTLTPPLPCICLFSLENAFTNCFFPPQVWRKATAHHEMVFEQELHRQMTRAVARTPPQPESNSLISFLWKSVCLEHWKSKEQNVKISVEPNWVPHHSVLFLNALVFLVTENDKEGDHEIRPRPAQSKCKHFRAVDVCFLFFSTDEV